MKTSYSRKAIRDEALRVGHFNVYDWLIDGQPTKNVLITKTSFSNDNDFVKAYENNFITQIIQENWKLESQNKFYIRKHEMQIEVTNDEIIFNYF